MDVQDAQCGARYLIRDRDGKFPELFDAVMADAGITVVLTCVRMPRMNALMERWVQTCRRELLDRTLIWNQHHLLHALREFEDFYNEHRPHRSLNGAPLRLAPEAFTNQADSISVTSFETGSVAFSMSTNMLHDLHRRNNRHPQGPASACGPLSQEGAPAR